MHARALQYFQKQALLRWLFGLVYYDKMFMPTSFFSVLKPETQIFLFMIFFCNVLVQFLKHQHNAPMVAIFVEKCMFIPCRTCSSLQKAIVSIPGMCFTLFLIAIPVILRLKIFKNQFVYFV